MINKINDFYEKYFSKDHLFLISYTAIHFIVIFYQALGFTNTFTPPIFYKFSEAGLHNNVFAGYQGYVYSYLLILMIFLIDVGFLIVLMFEFQFLRLNFKKVLFLEIILIGISFTFPFFREIMFFMSFNTIGIYVIYRIILKNIWYFRFPFLFTSYVFLIRLIISPFWELYKINQGLMI